MATDDFFRARLDQMIDLRHPLVVLAGRMPWGQIEAALAPAFVRKNRAGQVMPGSDLFGTTLEIAGAGVSAAGRPRLPIRLMAALLYLKHAFNLSDEELVARWSENVVWQYFSGLAYYTPNFPCDATQIGRFRAAIGEAGVEELLKAIRDKAEIMVDHFLEQVIGQHKIGGLARAMVVTGNIQRAIQYFFAFRAYLTELKSPYQAIVAFSGEPEYNGEKVSEAKLNGFPSNDIADRIQEDPYRFLICADKFQTGYDEPLLHTMYVDKALSGIKAVQTLSRLNRAHPKKSDVFVLDFQNDTETIEKSFADYYRTTILSSETDPNKLHTLKGELDQHQVYAPEQIDALVELFLGGASREKLDPILDACVAVYVNDLDEDKQVDFKGKAKTFTRTYDFLATILPYGVQEWEKLSIFLNFLIAKLPAPIEEDLAKGILDAIDMDSYRAEKKAMIAIALPDVDAEIEPTPTGGGGRKPEPEMDKLSNIVKQFNDQFGGLFLDSKAVEKRIVDIIPPKVAADPAYQNAMKNTPSTARIEHDKALKRVITAMFKDDAQLFKQFQDNESFRGWLTATVFGLTSGEIGS